MKFTRLLLIAPALIGFGMASCERHSLEETRQLFKAHGGDHGDDHGHEKDAHGGHDSHAKKDAHAAEKSAPKTSEKAHEKHEGDAKDVGI